MKTFGNIEIHESCIRIGPDIEGYWKVVGVIYALLLGAGGYFTVTESGGWMALVFIVAVIACAISIHTGARVDIDAKAGTLVQTTAFFLRKTMPLASFHPEPFLVDKDGVVGWYLGKNGNPSGKQWFLLSSTRRPESPEPRYQFFSENVVPLLTEWLKKASSSTK